MWVCVIQKILLSDLTHGKRSDVTAEAEEEEEEEEGDVEAKNK